MGVRLVGANLRGANLTNASLNNAELVDTDLTGADVKGATFYGVKNVASGQIKVTNNRALAFYDDRLIKELSLPYNHNKLVKDRLDKQKSPRNTQNENGILATN